MKWIKASEINVFPERNYIAKYDKDFVNSGKVFVDDGVFVFDAHEKYGEVRLDCPNLYFLIHESELPSQPNGDEVVKAMDEFKEENLSDRCFSVYGIRKLLNLLLGEEISMSRFVELLNERASRQPEIDALREENDKLKADLFSSTDAAQKSIDALKNRVEELEDELHKIKHPF